MHVGKLVFSQVIEYLPMYAFRRCVARYDGNRYKKTFSCLDQYLCMAFAQLNGSRATARALSHETGVPLPTVVKLLKILTIAGLARSTQGRGGGYALARPPGKIGLTEIIETVEGPIALTECNRAADGCRIQDSCLTHRHWLVINQAVREALAGIRLADLAGLALSPGGLGDAVAAMTFFDRYPPG